MPRTYVNRKKRVLIIEDDRGLVKTLYNLLVIEGYEVITAENGESGIRLAFDDMPDIIVSDIVLSRISGYDVLRILKASTKTASIPFLFLTGKVKDKERAYGLALGADAYLDKPFEYQFLLDTMNRYLDPNQRITFDPLENILPGDNLVFN